jgi:hypothetical protein
MSNDEKIILLTFQLKNDWFKPDCYIVIRLSWSATGLRSIALGTYLCSWVPMVIRICFMLLHLIWILQPYPPLGHFLADAGVQLAHLGSLSNLVALALEPTRSFNCPPSSRSPHCKRLQWCLCSACLNQRSSFFFPVSQKGLAHFPSIIFPLR